MEITTRYLAGLYNEKNELLAILENAPDNEMEQVGFVGKVAIGYARKNGYDYIMYNRKETQKIADSFDYSPKEKYFVFWCCKHGMGWVEKMVLHTGVIKSYAVKA